MDRAFHRALAAFNHDRLTPALPDANWRVALEEEMTLRAREGELLESERRFVEERAAQAPRQSKGFVEWFEDLARCGPGQGDPLFPWLAEQASFDEMRWFLEQEIGGEAGFDDLVALSQLKLPDRAKLELARNYWDEMGRGAARGMHGPMLGRLAEELELPPNAEVVVESLALGNLMVSLAINRRWAYHSIGALGVIELTAPGRARLVNEGLKRLGASVRARQYFALHATLDVKHSEAWNKEVLRPLVSASPGVATAIAEGALMRLVAGQRCFERYRAVLGLGALGAAA
jgi:hypothetical protein